MYISKVDKPRACATRNRTRTDRSTTRIARIFPNKVHIPIQVRTPDLANLGLAGDKYSRLKPDLQDVTTASKDKASAAKRNGTNTGATPVGAYRLDPPTGGR
ncbi:hypothetical protein Bbelb_088160 [Branchiostoma belcheri]|nr:hypothetical protein Bbelb_088160 [Branchiostoma belcheri]